MICIFLYKFRVFFPSGLKIRALPNGLSNSGDGSREKYFDRLNVFIFVVNIFLIEGCGR